LRGVAEDHAARVNLQEHEHVEKTQLSAVDGREVGQDGSEQRLSGIAGKEAHY
jgi:hypothetical protein